MNNFANGQTNNNQVLIKGMVEELSPGKNFKTKNGYKLHLGIKINNVWYKLPFVDPGFIPCKEGDYVGGMAEEKVFNNRPYMEFDPKTFGLSSTGGVAQNVNQPLSTERPNSTINNKSSTDVQTLIVAQSSLAQSVAYHNGDNAGIDVVLADMRRFADAVYNYTPTLNNTQKDANVNKTAQKFEDDDVPF